MILKTQNAEKRMACSEEQPQKASARFYFEVMKFGSYFQIRFWYDQPVSELIA